MNEMDAVDNILLLSDSYKVSIQGHSAVRSTTFAQRCARGKGTVKLG